MSATAKLTVPLANSELIQIVADLEAAGAVLFLKGNGVGLRFPESQRENLKPLLSRIRERKAELVDYLRVRQTLPPGVRLIAWEPRQPPTVTDLVTFAIYTLRQLKAALEGKNWLAGNWSVEQLLKRLEEVGLSLACDTPPLGKLHTEDQFAHLRCFRGRRVWTPLGPGSLTAVTQEYATVRLEADGCCVRLYDSTRVLAYAQGPVPATPRAHREEVADPLSPRNKCPCCGNLEFWERPTGGWVCSRCHPNPHDETIWKR